MEGTARRPWHRWAPLVGLAAVVCFGAWTRAPGFTRKDLWFDDAWEVLPSKVGIGTAIHMVNTTPGYTLALRSWAALHPGYAWWDQVPAFALGVASIVAVYLLLRYYRASWPIALLGALVVAASPVAATYSTRVKQFNGDIVLACVLLWLFERWRREPSRRAAVMLAVGGAVAMLFSATTAIVVIPIAVAATLAALADRTRRRDAAILLCVVGVVGVVEYVVWLRHLSHSLYAGWSSRGYILSARSLHRVEYSLQAMGTGIFHWMLGAPTGHPGYPSGAVTASGLAIAAVAAIVLTVLVVPPLVAAARGIRSVPGPLCVPALCVALAVLLALVGVSPFGGGRTDEVLYPAILLLSAGALPVRSHEPSRADRQRRVAMAGVIVASLLLVALGATHRATYPSTSVRDAVADLDAQRQPGDVDVVDPWLTFTWADDDLSKTDVSLTNGYFPWSQGFHVVSRDKDVVISSNYFFPDDQYADLAHRTSRVWYVGVGRKASPSHPTPESRVLRTRNFRALERLGWTPTSTAVYETHVIAILMVHRH
jgi:hypothetical protein